MKNEKLVDLYNWNDLMPLYEKYMPKLIERQANIDNEVVIEELPDDKKEEIFNFGFSKEGKDPNVVIDYLIDDIMPYRMKTNHKNFFAFIPNALFPQSVLGQTINSFYNPYGGGFTISKGVAEMEKATLNLFIEAVGYEVKPAGAIYVSGGSSANLTAAILARDHNLYPSDINLGTVYLSDQTHSSMKKALHAIGIKKENVKVIESDENFKIKLDVLEQEIKKDIEAGYKPFMLIGTAGTTNTGSIDPLNELADIASSCNMWFHVDGAYGGSILLSDYAYLLKGVERSDSVTWDCHKWLFQNYGCATIIVKDKMKMLESFHTNPEYLKDVDSTTEDFNWWDVGFELTQPARGTNLWFTLQTVGLERIKEVINYGIESGYVLQEELSKFDHFEMMHEPTMGILNFRYVNKNLSEDELDHVNQMISKKILEDNQYAILTTILKGHTVLRIALNNVKIDRSDIQKIVETINQIIEEVVA